MKKKISKVSHKKWILLERCNKNEKNMGKIM